LSGALGFVDDLEGVAEEWDIFPLTEVNLYKRVLLI
jgi:hypothetical protein